MLTSCFQDPFRNALLSLKEINNSNPVIQHKDLNMIIKDLHSICILNNLLIRLIDFHHYRELCEAYQILAIEIDPTYADNLFISNGQQLPQYFQKSQQDPTIMGVQKMVKKDMTPSTRKSRAIATPNIAILVQDLIESIENFESIQQNLEHLMSLIQNFQKKQQILAENDGFERQDYNFQRLYDFVDKKLSAQNNICNDKKNVEILQIHKLIKEFVEFMNNVVSSSNQIQQVMKSQSPYSQESQQILQGLSMNENYSKRSNDARSKRSLLTEMLRDSSQKSNFEGQCQLPARQLCLRPATKEYSQKQNNQMVIDTSYRISLVKTQKPRFNSQKLIKSEMEHAIQGIDQRRRKAQIHAKKNGIGCSNCQIF